MFRMQSNTRPIYRPQNPIRPANYPGMEPLRPGIGQFQPGSPHSPTPVRPQSANQMNVRPGYPSQQMMNQQPGVSQQNLNPANKMQRFPEASVIGPNTLINSETNFPVHQPGPRVPFNQPISPRPNLIETKGNIRPRSENFVPNSQVPPFSQRNDVAILRAPQIKNQHQQLISNQPVNNFQQQQVRHQQPMNFPYGNIRQPQPRPPQLQPQHRQGFPENQAAVPIIRPNFNQGQIRSQPRPPDFSHGQAQFGSTIQQMLPNQPSRSNILSQPSISHPQQNNVRLPQRPIAAANPQLPVFDQCNRFQAPGNGPLVHPMLPPTAIGAQNINPQNATTNFSPPLQSQPEASLPAPLVPQKVGYVDDLSSLNFNISSHQSHNLPSQQSYNLLNQPKVNERDGVVPGPPNFQGEIIGQSIEPSKSISDLGQSITEAQGPFGGKSNTLDYNAQPVRPTQPAPPHVLDSFKDKHKDGKTVGAMAQMNVSIKQNILHNGPPGSTFNMTSSPYMHNIRAAVPSPTADSEMNQMIHHPRIPTAPSSNVPDLIPYAGPKLPPTPRSGISNAGILYSTKPLMCPTHDDIVSNILGKNDKPSTELENSQLNMQQQLLLQQQQMMILTQTKMMDALMKQQKDSEKDKKIQELELAIEMIKKREDEQLEQIKQKINDLSKENDKKQASKVNSSIAVVADSDSGEGNTSSDLVRPRNKEVIRLRENSISTQVQFPEASTPLSTSTQSQIEMYEPKLDNESGSHQTVDNKSAAGLVNNVDFSLVQVKQNAQNDMSFNNGSVISEMESVTANTHDIDLITPRNGPSTVIDALVNGVNEGTEISPDSGSQELSLPNTDIKKVTDNSVKPAEVNLNINETGQGKDEYRPEPNERPAMKGGDINGDIIKNDLRKENTDHNETIQLDEENLPVQSSSFDSTSEIADVVDESDILTNLHKQSSIVSDASDDDLIFPRQTINEKKEIKSRSNTVQAETSKDGVPPVNSPSSTSVIKKVSSQVSKIISPPNSERGSNISSPNGSRNASPILTRKKDSMIFNQGRASPLINGQNVQLDDIEHHEPIDHRHLARQLGRMSFYVGEPDERIWRKYITELDNSAKKLHEECITLCKPAGDTRIAGFQKIWNVSFCFCFCFCFIFFKRFDIKLTPKNTQGLVKPLGIAFFLRSHFFRFTQNFLIFLSRNCIFLLKR